MFVCVYGDFLAPPANKFVMGYTKWVSNHLSFGRGGDRQIIRNEKTNTDTDEREKKCFEN